MEGDRGLYLAHVDGVVVSGVVFLGIYGGEAAFFVEVFEV